MKTIFKLLVLISTFTLSFSVFATGKDKLSEALLNSVDMINKQAPQMIDEETQLTHASAKDHTIRYHYKMVNYTAADFDLEVFMTQAEEIVNASACGSSLVNIMKVGGTIEYVYSGNDDTEIGRVQVNKGDCAAQ